MELLASDGPHLTTAEIAECQRLARPIRFLGYNGRVYNGNVLRVDPDYVTICYRTPGVGLVRANLDAASLWRLRPIEWRPETPHSGRWH